MPACPGEWRCSLQQLKLRRASGGLRWPGTHPLDVGEHRTERKDPGQRAEEKSRDEVRMGSVSPGPGSS